jgi:hypothetical protein
MQSQVIRTFPFFDFVVQTGNSLAQVNGTLRDHLKAQVPVMFKTCFLGTASGGILKVRVHWLGASLSCIGEGECCPARDGTSITVRVRWPYWWLLGVGLFFIVGAGKELLEGTPWAAGLWVWSLIVGGGGLWVIQLLAGRALLRFVTTSISSDRLQSTPPNTPLQPAAEKRRGSAADR